jgi:hypothetical protein
LGDDEPDYGRNTVVKTSGGLEVWTEGNNETKVQVSSHPEGIGLKLSNGMGQMSVLLLPEDIKPLCRELLELLGVSLGVFGPFVGLAIGYRLSARFGVTYDPHASR